MKKVIQFLFLSIFLLSLASCGSKSKSPKNDLEKMNLKGDVIALKDGDYKFYFFNQNGFIDKIIYYSSNDVDQIEDYLYSNNLLDKQIVKMEISDESVITNCIYDEKKQLIRKSSKWSLGGDYSYYLYNNDGKIIKDSFYQELFFNKKDKPYTNFHVTNYFYNNDTIVYTEYIDKDGKTLLKYKDEFGDFYETENRRNNVEYVKDNMGNWVESKWDTDGKNYNRTRVIFYKGQDISNYLNTYINFKSSKSGNNVETPTKDENNTIIPSDNNSSSSSSINSTSAQNVQEKRECYDCKGTGQCPKCSKPQRVRYKQGESPSDHNEIRLGMIVCTQCGGNLMNWGSDKNKSCYLCKASGWLYCPECNSSGNGSYIGKCKRCKGTGFDR